MPTPPDAPQTPDTGDAGDHARRRIDELERELQALRDDHDAFAYAISHDLRSPLRHIQGHLELFQHQMPVEPGSAAAKYLGTVTSAADRLTRMLDGLLQHSRLGRAALSPRTAPMAALALEAQATVVARTGAGRAIQWDIGPLPAAWGDPLLLRELWVQVLDNAVKFTARTPEARIELSGWPEPDGRVRYAVQDNGAGFEPAQAGKLFAVFQRLHLPRDFDGLGLGLALARRIVERHGGRIEATGASGAGCRVTWWLPGPPP